MGKRAMLRANKRITGDKPNEYIITLERLEEIRNEAEKAIKEAQAKTIKSMIVVFAIALNNELGFGTKRINAVNARAMLQFQCIQSGELSQEDLEIWCEENNIKF